MEERKIKIVFFDVDGTIYDAEKDYVSHSTLLAINKLHELGIKCVICTGRGIEEYFGVNKKILDLPFDAFITSGGSEVYLRNKELIYTSYLSKEAVESVNEILQYATYDIDCIFKDKYGSGVTALPKECGIINFEWFNRPLYDIRKYDEESFVHAILAAHKEYHEDILSQLKDVAYLVSSPFSIDIYPKGTTKMTGVKILLDHFGISISETMAFGDSLNDVELLTNVNIGVCMGNGSEEAKKSSDFVTKDIYNDGIYIALKKYGVIE